MRPYDELGGAYEREVEIIRRSRLNETAKGKMIKLYTQNAADAYGRIITRYPLEPRAGDARKRLEAMKQPVPKATAEAIAEDKKEIESRGSMGTIGKVMENFHRGPDVSEAARIGEPTLVDPKQSSAPDMVRAAAASVSASLPGGGNSVTVEKVGDGTTPPENAPVPRSDATPAASDSATPGVAASDAAPASAPAGSDMKNDLATQGNTAPAAPLPPTQVNDVAGASSSSSGTQQASTSAASQATPANSDTESSSKKKKKKHLLLF